MKDKLIELLKKKKPSELKELRQRHKNIPALAIAHGVTELKAIKSVKNFLKKKTETNPNPNQPISEAALKYIQDLTAILKEPRGKEKLTDLWRRHLTIPNLAKANGLFLLSDIQGLQNWFSVNNIENPNPYNATSECALKFIDELEAILTEKKEEGETLEDRKAKLTNLWHEHNTIRQLALDNGLLEEDVKPLHNWFYNNGIPNPKPQKKASDLSLKAIKVLCKIAETSEGKDRLGAVWARKGTLMKFVLALGLSPDDFRTIKNAFLSQGIYKDKKIKKQGNMDRQQDQEFFQRIQETLGIAVKKEERIKTEEIVKNENIVKKEENQPELLGKRSLERLYSDDFGDAIHKQLKVNPIFPRQITTFNGGSNYLERIPRIIPGAFFTPRNFAQPTFNASQFSTNQSSNEAGYQYPTSGTLAPANDSYHSTYQANNRDSCFRGDNSNKTSFSETTNPLHRTSLNATNTAVLNLNYIYSMNLTNFFAANNTFNALQNSYRDNFIESTNPFFFNQQPNQASYQHTSLNSLMRNTSERVDISNSQTFFSHPVVRTSMQTAEANKFGKKNL